MSLPASVIALPNTAKWLDNVVPAMLGLVKQSSTTPIAPATLPINGLGVIGHHLS